jgi:hypothetical protein
VSGNSFIKWHLAHSIHAEHRGRTEKVPISNHKVDYSYSKTVPHIRISVDRNNYLTECPIEFEILQEFAIQEKITLGVVRLNLSEYVEESESFLKENPSQHARRRASSVGISPTNATHPTPVRKSTDVDTDVPEGIVRRYLMQESKINSTLKISLLLVQVDGDRSYVAPALRSAPTFGGIAGIVANEQADDEAGPTPSIAKPRDAAEIQDLYRRTLAASWCRLPVEPTADESIEDIFSGGNGWRSRNDTSNTDTEDDTGFAGQGTLRPSDLRRISQRHHQSSHNHHRHQRQGHHLRQGSGSSDKSALTVTGRKKGARLDDKDSESGIGLSRSGSLGSLSSSLSGGDRTRGEKGHRHATEVGEHDVRQDLIAWRLPDGVAA